MMSKVSSALSSSQTRLDELMAEDTPVQDILVSKISPWDGQPRKYFDPKGIASLANSFKENGFKGTILVRPKGRNYLIVFGERRWRAAKEAGLQFIPCFVEEMDDAKALDLAMGENLLREDLSKLEEAEGLLAVIKVETSLPEEEIIRLVNSSARHWKNGFYVGTKSDAAQHIPVIAGILSKYGVALNTFKSKHLQVLNLPEDVKEAHLKDGLPYSQALAIGRIADDYDRQDILSQVGSEGMTSFAEVDAAVREMTAPEQSKGDELKTRFNQATSRLRSQKTWKIVSADKAKTSRIKALVEELEGLLDD
mgnify:CR=1 FL=1